MRYPLERKEVLLTRGAGLARKLESRKNLGSNLKKQPMRPHHQDFRILRLWGTVDRTPDRVTDPVACAD